MRVTSVTISAARELGKLFSRLHRLPRLETINLTFFSAYGHWLDFDGEGRLALQESTLRALATSFSVRSPSKLTSLSLHNLHTWDVSPLESPPFQAVLKTLRRLQLSVIYDRARDLAIASDRWSHFWGTLCCHLVLAPTQHFLTELARHGNVHVGASLKLCFAGLHFPRLRALSCKILFEPSVGAEPFILRHAATLTRLHLIACKLPFDTPSTPDEELTAVITWKNIWDSFATDLTALVALHVDESDGDSLEYPFVHPGSAVYSTTGRCTLQHILIALTLWRSGGSA